MPFGPRDLSMLIRELKRRRVFRVAVAYLAISWVAIDVSDTLLPALGAPGWAISVEVVLLILAFPAVFVVGWMYDITPEGIGRTESLSRRGETERTSGPAAIAGPRESIVVLPMRDRSPKGEYQFLGDGITEELIYGLASLEGLRVVSCTSAFSLRDVGDVRDLGARLGVGSVVEGSVLVREERLRLSVQLVSAADGMAVWSESFDRRIEDIFEIQEDVARAIVAVVGRELGSRSEVANIASGARLLSTSTRNPDAYQLYLKGRHHRNADAYPLYLKGRHHWNQRTGSAFRRAIEYFEQATRLDPGFAQAWAGLAESWALLMEYGLAPLAEGLGPAREAAELALSVGSDLAEAHAAAALVRQLELDLAAAASESEAAVALNPGYAPAHHRWSLILAWLGRFDESRRQNEAALALDPMSPAIAATTGWIAYYARAYEDTVVVCAEVLQDHSGFATARIPLGLALVQLGRFERAVEELRRAHQESGSSASGLALVVYALGRAGRYEEARALAHEVDTIERSAYVPLYYRAVMALGLDELDSALEMLARAAAARAPQLVYLGVEPAFDPLRGRPEFVAVLESVGIAGPS